MINYYDKIGPLTYYHIISFNESLSYHGTPWDIIRTNAWGLELNEDIGNRPIAYKKATLFLLDMGGYRVFNHTEDDMILEGNHNIYARLFKNE